MAILLVYLLLAWVLVAVGQSTSQDESEKAKSSQSATTATPVRTALSNSATVSDISQPTATAPSNTNVDGPPAYITWKTPLPNTAYPPLYKIGASTVTMEWDIDHEALQVPPINITVAIVSPQKETFIADVLPGSATSATWDLVNMTRPLMVGHFTVSIYDQRGPTAIPSPGQLMPDSRLTLALYNTETYVAPTDGQRAQLRLVLSQQMAFSLLAMWDAPTSKMYTTSVIRFMIIDL
ncbi:unnamed protein product [Umbelopsis vinacea]